MNPVFVVGTGRCGSTLLSQLLHLHPEVLSASEFLAVLKAAVRSPTLPAAPLDGAELWALLTGTVPELDALIAAGLTPPEMTYPYGTGRFTTEHGIPLICHDLLPTLTDEPDALFDRLADEVPRWPRRPAAAQYRAFLGLLARLFGRRLVVERSAASLLLVDDIDRLFPGSRIAHIHRDGPDCALSMSRHPAYRRELISALAVRDARRAGLGDLSPAALEAALPRYRGLLGPPYDAERFRRCPLPVESFARGYWSGMIRAGTAMLARLPADRRTQLSYEDLLADPAGSLTDFARFLGVDAPASWLATAARTVDGTRAGRAAAELPPRRYAALVELCAPATRALAALDAARQPDRSRPGRPARTPVR
ncbi:hypothetical protein GCM10010129_24530 [Streptomyces fumigatiscleroticus]|nr:hypothetical protein GCM10010129_24530 [Streptomyces fumigatiscleroticus]